MNDLPHIDPAWIRKRQRPVQEESLLVPILLSAGVLAVLLLMARAFLETDDARAAAARRSKEIAESAHQRLSDRLEDERVPVHYITEAEADRQLAQGMTGSSIEDRSIHRCVYRTSSSYQTEPCKAPWLDAPQERGYSRQENVAEQARAQARAEARLRAEEDRFAALTGQQSWSQPAYSTDSRGTARQRCAIAKAQRDEAYRLVGNNRTFNFIRGWDDVVYEACKNT